MHALSKTIHLPRPELSSVDSQLCEIAIGSTRVYCTLSLIAIIYTGMIAIRFRSTLTNNWTKPKDWKPVKDADQCPVSESVSHCECFVLLLHKHLGEWMPKDLRFCNECKRFTRRVKRHNMRCECRLKMIPAPPPSFLFVNNFWCGC